MIRERSLFEVGVFTLNIHGRSKVLASSSGGDKWNETSKERNQQF